VTALVALAIDEEVTEEADVDGVSMEVVALRVVVVFADVVELVGVEEDVDVEVEALDVDVDVDVVAVIVDAVAVVLLVLLQLLPHIVGVEAGRITETALE
jgi:hypothetical protein